jgi:hypothetical protein
LAISNTTSMVCASSACARIAKAFSGSIGLARAAAGRSRLAIRASRRKRRCIVVF